jgi:hypothetical protein
MKLRVYNFKDEELIIIAGFILFALKRDFADFVTFLPKLFNSEYIPKLESKIIVVNNLINPQAETVELKNTTARLYAAMDGLLEPADRVIGYIKFTKGAVPISAKDFGLTALKQKIRIKDAEGVLKNLRTIDANLQKYREPLTEQGLTDDVIAKFTAAVEPIETDNQRQFEIVDNRKRIAHENVNLLNDLYNNIVEVCNVGKNLYKGKDSLKVQDYTFTALRKKVRIVAKPAKTEKNTSLEN